MIIMFYISRASVKSCRSGAATAAAFNHIDQLSQHNAAYLQSTSRAEQLTILLLTCNR